MKEGEFRSGNTQISGNEQHGSIQPVDPIDRDERFRIPEGHDYGWDVTVGQNLRPEEIAVRETALEHYRMFLRRQYRHDPTFNWEQIDIAIGSHIADDAGLEPFLRGLVAMDRLDAALREEDPQHKNWYED